MAEVWHRTRGARKMPIQRAMGFTEEAQDAIEEFAFVIGVRAEEALIHHKFDDHARIEVERGDMDRYVTLDDTRGLDAAMSIEFGRAGYVDPETGRIVGRMEPLYILTDASNLPRRARRMPSFKPYKKNADRKRHRRNKRRRARYAQRKLGG